MAIFSNQATLTYDGTAIHSNIAYAELIESLSVVKTALTQTYSPGEILTYAVTLRNTSATAITGLTVTDDMGGYFAGTGVVYPLRYVQGTARLFANGVLQPLTVVSGGPPLVFSGIRVEGEGDTVLLYQAEVTAFADPAQGGTIVNTVQVTGCGLPAAITAAETVTARSSPDLTVTKTVTPAQVMPNERVTYTLVIRNMGFVPVVATDNAVITDPLAPVLTDLTVRFEGADWTQGVQYTYSEATGRFATLPGWLTVPAATVTQDPATGEYTVIPGTATLTVTGTI